MDTISYNELLETFNNTRNNESIPDWASVLIDGMKAIITEFKGINEVLTKIKVLEDFKAVNETVTEYLSDDNKRLHENIKALETRIDDNEQRSRNGCLLIHGVMESERENTDDIALDIINNELGLRDLCIDNIQRSHRLGPRKKPTNQRNLRSIATTIKPRPIIIRFASYRDRQKVFLAKSNLKGKKMMITENLTQRLYSILQAAVMKE